jgi:hypothetical protein
MKLLDLRRSIRKLPPDMDDMELMVSYANGTKRMYEPLCFVGYCPLSGHEFFVLGTLSEVQRMVEKGEMQPPKGYVTPEQMKPFSLDNEDDDE